MAKEVDLAVNSAPDTVPVPVASVKALRDVDRLGTIGVEALKSKGYFTRIVIATAPLARS